MNELTMNRAATLQHISLEDFVSIYQQFLDTLSSSTAFPHDHYSPEVAAS
jgi:hypothetical protein